MSSRKAVLVTRPAGQAEGLCELVEAAGASAIRLPAIEIRPATDSASLQAAIASLERFDLAVFVSINAVNTGLAAILQARGWPPGVLLATVGPASRAAVEALGLDVDLVPDHDYSSEGLL
ncbi:MAG: uroporphyrinogen-III synthase, partial [Thiohalobacterales bacterium]|nr:uroporphyrinogen-III synthase [Thiohalobacterales bacterium]